MEFPKDNIVRHFSYTYYDRRKLGNYGVVGRKWLVYFKHVNQYTFYDDLQREVVAKRQYQCCVYSHHRSATSARAGVVGQAFGRESNKARMYFTIFL